MGRISAEVGGAAALTGLHTIDAPGRHDGNDQEQRDPSTIHDVPAISVA